MWCELVNALVAFGLIQLGPGGAAVEPAAG
jgi:hypothetical protein